MRILLNGEARELPEGCTVAALLESLGARREGVAVAVDRRVVPRSEHEARRLHEGEAVEVITAVGGG